jgi:hypothetical protein
MKTTNSLLFLLHTLSKYKIAVLLLFCIPLFSLQAAVASENRVGVILAFSGQVEVLHGTAKFVPEKHTELYSGDSIVTANGQAQIRFLDGTLMTLYRDTKFAIDDYHYSKNGDDKAQFSLINGVMHTLTGQIDKKNYLLKTRLANLGVRGTEYSVQLDDALHVSVDQGRVQLVNAGGSAFVDAGQSIFIMGANVMGQAVLGGKVDLGMRGPGAGGRAGPGGPGGKMGGPGGGMGGPGAGMGGPGGGMGAPPPSGTQKF